MTELKVANMPKRRCMSYLNARHKDKQCIRESMAKEDFCRYHNKNKIYLMDLQKPKEKAIIIKNSKNVIPSPEDIHEAKIHELDENHSETLMGIHDSWRDIPIQYWIYVGKRNWDLRILCDIIANQLCSSELENPKPTYPHDPFNRYNYTTAELVHIRNKIVETKLRVYIGLQVFLDFIHKNTSLKINQEFGTNNSIATKIILILQTKLRYMLCNSLNSQDCYTGYWVKKEEPKTCFEDLYKLVLGEPMQIIQMGVLHHPHLVDNPRRKQLENILKKYPQENTQLDQEHLLTYIE